MNEIEKIQLYKCPTCDKYFSPEGSNNIYCCSEHGSDYRNQIKNCRNKYEVASRKGRLCDLKILNKLYIKNCICLSQDGFFNLKINIDNYKRISPPRNNSDEVSKWFEVHGYFISLLNDGYYFIYEPNFFKV